MKGREMIEMQRRIDEGIQLAHRRLATRARMDNLPLVMYRDGHVVEMVPELIGEEEKGREGDPLSRKRYK